MFVNFTNGKLGDDSDPPTRKRIYQSCAAAPENSRSLGEPGLKQKVRLSENKHLDFTSGAVARSRKENAVAGWIRTIH